MATRAAISSASGGQWQAVAAAAVLHLAVGMALVMIVRHPATTQVLPEINVSFETTALEVLPAAPPPEPLAEVVALPHDEPASSNIGPALVEAPTIKPTAAPPRLQPKPTIITPHAAPVAVVQPTVVKPPAPVIASPPSQAWRGWLDTWLRTHRTYPALARRRGEQGVVSLRFTVRRDGQVLDVALANSSGSTLLDEAATALLAGAVVPGFSDDMGSVPLSVTVSVNYRLN